VAGKYTSCCTMNDKNVLAWYKLGILKLRGLRRGSERRRYPLCRQEENNIYILLKCRKTQIWIEKGLNCKWLNINEDIAYTK
jgi:hypothetical protein